MAWTWGSIGDRVVGPLLNTPMKALENYLGRAEREFPIRDRVATTDATVTTISTIPVPVNHTLLIVAYIVARRTGGSAGSANDGAAYRLEVAAKNTSGTAAELAAETLTVIGESQAGWTVASSASGGNILLRVTGAADNNVQWRASVRTLALED
jgi:hypothetical protein